MKIKFWSSTEYSGFLAGLMRELTEAGFGARQCYQISESDYRSAKSTPARLFLRFRQYVVYPAQLIVALSMQRVRVDRSSCKFKEETVVPQGKSVQVDSSSDESEPGTGTTTPSLNSNCNDVCVVSTNTFYAPLIATYLHPHVVHLVYDLFPEAMIHSGKWTEGTFKVKIVRWITKQTLKRSKTNVFLGQRLKDYVESIHGPVENTAIIAVGADQSLFRLSPKQRLMKADEARQCVDGEPKVCPEPAKGDESGCPLGERGTNFGKLKPMTGEGQRLEEGKRLAPKGIIKEGELRPEEGSCEGATLNSNSKLELAPSPTILYCGNFGNMHDSATLFDYWNQVAESGIVYEPVQRFVPSVAQRAPASLTPPGQTVPIHHLRATRVPSEFPQWLFHCSGPKRASLETERAQLPDLLKEQIHLGGGLDQAAWITTMESADVALVTMVPGSETVVMPSKTYSAMMAGQAILAIAPEDSDLVDTIKAADCGWFVEAGDVAGLAKVIDAICSDAEGVLEKRENAYSYAHAHLGQDSLAKDWMDALRAES